MSKSANAPNPMTRMADAVSKVPLLRVVVEAFRGESRASDALLLVMSASYVSVVALAVRQVGAYDTDGWWILATGREIACNGIPHLCTWAAEGTFPVVVQQWLHDVIAYSAYCAWGYAGVDAYAMALAAAAAVAMYASVRFLSKGRAAFASCFAASCLGVSGAGMYMSIRPTMYSVMAFLAVVCVCVGARRSGKPSLYLLLPVVSCIHMQFQMSMAALDVMAAAAFLLPWSKDELGKGMGAFLRSRLPLLGCILLMLPAMLANPYGADGALYLLRGYGEAAYSNAILEMYPLWRAEPPIVFVWALAAAVPALFAAKRGKLPPAPFIVLWLGGMAAGLVHIRNIWILTAASMVVVAVMLAPCGEGRIDLKRPALGGMPLALLCVALMASAPVVNSLVMGDPAEGDVKASGWDDGEQIRPLAERILADHGDDAKVYVDWEILNAVLEWDGVKVMFDIRPELWIGTDADGNVLTPYRDFVDAKADAESLERYVLGGDWDCFVVASAKSGDYAERYGLKEVAASGQFSLMEPTEVTEIYKEKTKGEREGEQES